MKALSASGQQQSSLLCSLYRWFFSPSLNYSTSVCIQPSRTEPRLVSFKDQEMPADVRSWYARGKQKGCNSQLQPLSIKDLKNQPTPTYLESG